MNKDYLERAYTVGDLEELRFYQMPKELFESKYYKELSLSAKAMYSILRDRQLLSNFKSKTNDYWIDENGKVFFYFDCKKLAKLLNISTSTVNRYKKELLKYKLLYQMRQGINKPNKMYVLSIENAWISEFDKSRNTNMINQEVSKSLRNDTELNNTELSDNNKNNYRVQETCTRMPFSDIITNSSLQGSNSEIEDKTFIIREFFKNYKYITGYDKHFDIGKDVWIELDEQLDFILEVYESVRIKSFSIYLDELILEYFKLGSKNNYYSLQGFLNRKRLLYIFHRLEYIGPEEIFDIDGEFLE